MAKLKRPREEKEEAEAEEKTKKARVDPTPRYYLAMGMFMQTSLLAILPGLTVTNDQTWGRFGLVHWGGESPPSHEGFEKVLRTCVPDEPVPEMAMAPSLWAIEISKEDALRIDPTKFVRILASNPPRVMPGSSTRTFGVSVSEKDRSTLLIPRFSSPM